MNLVSSGFSFLFDSMSQSFEEVLDEWPHSRTNSKPMCPT